MFRSKKRQILIVDHEYLSWVAGGGAGQGACLHRRPSNLRWCRVGGRGAWGKVIPASNLTRRSGKASKSDSPAADGAD